MPVLKEKQKLLHVPANTIGKDYVVADLHGCYDDFMKALDLLQFNKETDRVLCVGDLIDRGPDSMKCAQLIYQDWFYSVKGNHEDFAIHATIYKDENKESRWLRNGGAWSKAEDKTEVLEILNDLDKLPLIIAVGSGENRFNIVHAEILSVDRNSITDALIDGWQFDAAQEQGMLWGRTLIQQGPNKEKPNHHNTEMSLTFCGHTNIKEVVQVERQMFIDLGAVYGYEDRSNQNRQLVFACPQAKMLHGYRMNDCMMVETPFVSVEIA